MEALTSLLNVLNSLSPLGVIALLGLVIFMLVKAKTAKVEMDQKVANIADNHLHDLPSIADNMEKAVATLQRIEVKMGEEFSYIRARLNGKG